MVFLAFHVYVTSYIVCILLNECFLFYNYNRIIQNEWKHILRQSRWLIRVKQLLKKQKALLLMLQGHTSCCVDGCLFASILWFYKPLVKLNESRVYQYCKLHINITFITIKYYMPDILLVPIIHDTLLYNN